MDASVQQNSEPSPWKRISQIESNTAFIQSQYRTMLTRLHAEINSLKSANRDLQFQLILLHQANQSVTSASQSQDPQANQSVTSTSQSHDTDSQTNQNPTATISQNKNIGRPSLKTFRHPIQEGPGLNYTGSSGKTVKKGTDGPNAKGRPDKNLEDKSVRNPAIENRTSPFELDCTSKYCSLKFRCDLCQSYTPLRVSKLESDSELKALLSDIYSPYHESFEAVHPNIPNHNGNINNFSQRNISVNQTCDHHHHHTTNQIEAEFPPSDMRANLFPTNQINNLNSHPSSQNSKTLFHHCPPNLSHNPNSADPTSSLRQNPHSITQHLKLSPIPDAITQHLKLGPLPNSNAQNPSQIVHKTYVLSIEDTDPTSSQTKVQKTIVWSKRQTFETESEPPCILPPLQRWQESRCTSGVRKMQPSTSPTILPEIVSKK